MLDAHEQRLRQARTREKLRILRLPRPLLLDHYYLGGSLNSWQWSAGHLFREERLLLIEARARHQVRLSATELKPHAELKPRKAATGFSMSSVAIERALGLERWLEPQWFEWALGLIGERMITVEIPWAQRTMTALAEFYGIRPARIVGRHS